MGFGKFLACAIGGALAVVAAPIVLPAAAAAAAGAAAAGAAAAGAAAAGVAAAGSAAAGAVAAGAAVAGTAITGTVAATGTALAGAATTAGSLAAGAATATGAAVAGAATAAGSAVAGAASAIGAGTVAGAATSAGAAVAGAATTAGAAAAGAATTAAQVAATLASPAASAAAKRLAAQAVVKTGAKMAVGMVAANMAQSFVDNVVKEKVKPVPGCIVRCDLALGAADHTGVYIGSNKIVELDGDGDIRMVTPGTFMDNSVQRTGISIYIACDQTGKVLYNGTIADRARTLVGSARNYQWILDNCHQFTSGCITNDFENADNFFWMLEDTISRRLNNGSPVKWLVWDR